MNTLRLTKKDFKDISGFIGLYKINKNGEVKSLKREKWQGNGWQTIPEKILKPIKNNKGYLVINLCKDGKQKSFKIHRLVAETFIKNKKNLPQVNHINGVKTNNNVKNLEWVTPSDNMKHSINVLNNKKPSISKKLSLSGKTVKVELDGVSYEAIIK